MPSENSSAVSTNEMVSSSTQPLFGLGYRSHAILSIGAYGELKFGGQDAPGGWKDGFDAGRIVLLPTFQVTDNIIFNAEIEFEHGGIAEDADDKLTGSVELEQAYIDFRFNEHFNWCAPGVDVVPFGLIHLFHEPTQFYSVQRPELDNGLIPTTWFEGSSSIYGKIVDNLNYQFRSTPDWRISAKTAACLMVLMILALLAPKRSRWRARRSATLIKPRTHLDLRCD